MCVCVCVFGSGVISISRDKFFINFFNTGLPYNIGYPIPELSSLYKISFFYHKKS